MAPTPADLYAQEPIPRRAPASEDSAPPDTGGGNLAGLSSAFSKLGISPDTAAKFVPTVTDFVSKMGGADVGNLLKGAPGLSS